MGSNPSLAIMNCRLTIANEYLKSKLDNIKLLYNGLIRISNVFFQNKENKRIILHLYFPNKRKCITYAKLLLELKLERLLVNDETCDHIDGDCTNDSLDNLQILSMIDNARKGASDEIKNRGYKIISLKSKGKEKLLIQGELNKTSKLSNVHVLEIKELQKKYYRGQDYKLAEKYGVSRSTIKGIRLGYWRIRS